MGKLNQQTFLQKCGFKDNELNTKTHDDIVLHYMNKGNIFKMLDESEIFYLCKNEKASLEIITEFPITTRSDYIIGYIDLKIKLKIHEYISDKERLRKKVGFGNILKPDWYYVDENEYYCEIKSKPIENFGALMRQLNTYREHIRSSPKLTCGSIILISNGKCKFKDAFKSQGIVVYEHGI